MRGLKDFGRPPRVMGVDVARAVAVVGMIAAHVGGVPDLEWNDPSTWAGLANGRSSLLFALVAACSSSGNTPTPGDDASAMDTDAMDMDAMDMDAMAEDTAVVEDVTPLETGAVPAATIHVGNFYYNPKTVTVKVGDTVQWIWDGGTHTVTSGTSCTRDGKFDSGTHSTSKFVFTRKFTEAGTFGFFCDFMDHCTSRGQEGTVTVTPSSGDPVVLKDVKPGDDGSAVVPLDASITAVTSVEVRDASGNGGVLAPSP